MEIWKDIPGFNRYQISSYGRFKSLKKRILQKNGHPMTFPEKILKPTVSDSGYLYVTLTNNGKHKAMKIHRLVANQFLYRRKGTNVIHHIDHDKTNNRVSNLIWTTQQENMKFERINWDFIKRDKNGRFTS